MIRRLAACLAFVFLPMPPLAAQEPTPAAAAFFNEKVRPILAENCFKCHSHQAKKFKGGLSLDSRSGVLKGGESGPAIVPAHPEKSLLIQAVRGSDDLSMPPGAKKLGAGQIDVLVEWVKMGAPWTGKGAVATREGRFTDEDRAWWAIQPLKKVEPPKVDAAAWSKNPVDRFLYARLKKEGVPPAPPAARLPLLRRITFDLTGLPPTPAEIDAFLKDERADAFERVVDQLLSSPRFGEHWGRHWLDLVRYAESDGFRLDSYRPDAWRYRDYVIAAFNNDKPYDRFVREQIAGDEIDPTNPGVLVATAYLRHTIYEYNQRDVRTQWQNTLDDITNVTGEVFLGLGVGCARCHDHKYDPILQKDYYRLEAFFAPIRLCDDTPLATPEQIASFNKRQAAWEAKTVAVRKQIDDFLAPVKKRVEKDMLDKFPKDILAMIEKPEAERSPLEKQLAAMAYRQVQYEFDHIATHVKDAKAKKRYEELLAELAKFDADKPAPLPQGLTARDVGAAAPATYLPKKGRSITVEPGFLSILDENAAPLAPIKGGSTGRRLALAQWLTKPDHPLATRVIVNRLWQQTFGQGIVGTANDFGRVADQPTHPELLDWLAQEFVREGWSMKKMIRLMVTSQAYRQASVNPALEAARKDPDNRLFSRARPRRLTSEQIRDAILAAAGQLDLKAGGPSVELTAPRRSVYLKVRRNTRDPLLDAFDGPETFVSTAKRNVTTTPVQALLLLNSPFMVQQGKALADRLTKEHPKSDEERVAAAFLLAFGRRATHDEIEGALEFLGKQAERVGGDPAAARRTALIDFCQALLNANEFVYLD